MKLSVLFDHLVTAFHQDAGSDLVETLASDFAAQVALSLHEHGGQGCLLKVVKPWALVRYQNVHLLLVPYGLMLTKQLHRQGEAYLLGVSISQGVTLGECAGTVRVVPQPAGQAVGA
jgi:hypothetical protein